MIPKEFKNKSVAPIHQTSNGIWWYKTSGEILADEIDRNIKQRIQSNCNMCNGKGEIEHEKNDESIVIIPCPDCQKEFYQDNRSME